LTRLGTGLAIASEPNALSSTREGFREVLALIGETLGVSLG
jgi:hypothetical protein